MVSCSTMLSAQIDSMAIQAEKVEVVKRYEASILQARKKKISFEIEEKTHSPISYNYNVTTEKVIDFERPDPEIKALGYKGDPVTNPDLKDGYIYGAYGTHRTINAGAAYHYYIEDWLDAGFKVDHLSAQDTIDRYLSKMSQTQADVYLGYYLGAQSKVSLGGYTKLANHNSDNFSIDALSTLPINKFGGDINFSHNSFEDKGFSVRVDAGYDYAIHKEDRDINDKIMKGGLDIFKSINDKLSVNLPFCYQRLQASNLDTSELKVSDLMIEPNVRLKGQNYNLKAGVQYITGDSASYIFPIVDLTMTAIAAGIDLRLYTESEYMRNSLYNLSEINPYYYARSSDYSPSYKRSYNLAASYPLLDFIFQLGIGYNQYDNAVNFNESFERRGIATFLDRDELAITPEVSYSLDKNITVNLRGVYNFFLTEFDPVINLTYQPKFKLKLESEQLLFDNKLVLNQNLVYNSSRNVRIETWGFSNPSVDAFLDLSVQARYRISPSFDVFVKGTNLLGSDYYVWNRQDVFQQQIWGGLKFRI